MASITITYTAPEAPVVADVKQICSMFYPTGSYVDTAEYEGTIWDTNVEGWGTWEGLASFLEKLTVAPTSLIMFKQAFRDGTVTFDEEDAKQAAYYKELGKALEPYGFTLEVA